MNRILLIGIGGFVGSILRYGLSGLVHQTFTKTWFPVGTLIVNILGCFLIGLLGGLAENRQVFTPEFRLLVFIGFLGGFTTFSTFMYEIFSFSRDGQFFISFANLGMHIILGFCSAWFGNSISKIF